MENIAKQIGIKIINIKSSFDMVDYGTAVNYISDNTRRIITDSDVPSGAARWVSSRRTIGLAVRINWIKLIEEQNEKH